MPDRLKKWRAKKETARIIAEIEREDERLADEGRQYKEETIAGIRARNRVRDRLEARRNAWWYICYRRHIKFW